MSDLQDNEFEIDIEENIDEIIEEIGLDILPIRRWEFSNNQRDSKHIFWEVNKRKLQKILVILPDFSSIFSTKFSIIYSYL